ncbi:hypothetical protein EDC04DRAFT_2904789 [Pisolithus marmoratus]|nr:hypothetical protein EDC04DRAFT_2904789 [Pisolithus marmoratus]
MYAPVRRRLLSPRKTISVQPARRVVHRQYGTLFTSSTGAVRLPHRIVSSSGASAIWNIHVRTLSDSSIPKFVARTLIVPVAVVALGAGVLAYADYKFGQLWKKAVGWITTFQEAAAGLFNSASDGVKPHLPKVKDAAAGLSNTASDGVKAIQSRLSEAKVQGAAAGLLNSASDGVKSAQSRLSEVKVQDAAAGLLNSASNGVKSVHSRLSEVKVQDGAADLFNSASNGIKSAKSRLSEVKPPVVHTPRFLKDLFASGRTGKDGADNGDHARGSSGEEGKNHKGDA